MKTTLPLLLLSLFLAVTSASPLRAAEKGWIGLAFDLKGVSDSTPSVFSPTVMSCSVKYVFPNSPADGHHIVWGDIVVEINGQPITGCKLAKLKSMLQVKVGKTVSVKFRRSNGEIYTAELTAILKPK